MNNFYYHFFFQGKAVVCDSKIKGQTIDFWRKNKGQIRDRTGKILEKN